MTTGQIGPYAVLREIGRGGMGVVLQARDERLQRDVAIKSIAPALAADDARISRFKREASLIAQLNHPHIAQVYHLLEHAGQTYIILEYVPGRSLAEIIRGQGAMDPDTAIDLCAQVARAMEAAHARGIIHRDLKPANIRVTDDGRAKVLDFGLARRVREMASDDGEIATVVDTGDPAAHSLIMVGTPGYMAPEQVRSARVDARADIFSFGCTIYECLAGEVAYPGATARERIAAVVNTKVDLGKLPEGMTGQLRALVQRCLAVDPDDRFPDFGQVRRALEAARGRQVTPAAPDSSVAGIPVNLPASTTSFVGRDAQLRDLSDLLTQVRLLTLTGAGGCGKTRLAMELARRVVSEFPDGVYLAGLAPVMNPDHVAHVVAVSLGVMDRPGRTTLEVLCDHLAAKQCLLIVDNCEQVIDAASELIVELLTAAPALRIIATSRETTRVPGEHLWRVPSLTLPQSDDPRELGRSEAVTLFTERARAVRPDFDVTDTNAASITRICERLDGVPLAIELAAARVRILAPDQIDDMLDDRFRLLAGDARGVAERHRTLRATVDWSYLALSESEKRMFRTLSVFVGGWTLDAVTAVCAPGGAVEDRADLDDFSVLDLLNQLIDKSLVIPQDAERDSRFRMLGTLRHYAAEELDHAGETDAARDRHLDFHLALAEHVAPELTGADQAEWLERAAAEHENVLAALEHCDRAEGGAEKALRLCWAMMRFWLVRGYFKTGFEACITALARASAQARTTLRAGAMHVAGIMAQSRGDYDTAVALGAEALGIRRECNDRSGVAASLNGLGNTAYYHGDLAEAKRLHEESLAIRRELGDQPGIATSLNNLGNVAHDTGRHDEAQRMYEEALEINRRTDNRAWEAINLNNLGLTAYYRGDAAGAKQLHEASLAVRRDLGDRHGVAESLGHLGRIAGLQMNLDRARHLLGESLAIRSDVGDRLGIADALDGAAMVAARLRASEQTARLFGAAQCLRDEIGSPRPKTEREELEACLEPVRKTLGGAFDEIAAQQRSLDEVVIDALSWLGAGAAETADDVTR